MKQPTDYEWLRVFIKTINRQAEFNWRKHCMELFGAQWRQK